MEGKHTPTPWRYKNWRIAHVVTAPDGEVLDCKVICDTACNQSQRADPTNAANGRFIVHAANAHDDLVAALVEIKKWCDPTEYEEIHSLADAALAAAAPGEKEGDDDGS